MPPHLPRVKTPRE